MPATTPPPVSSVRALPSRAELFQLTLPQMGLMLCHLAISMTDVWCAGRLGPEVQAAVGVVAQIFSLLMLLTSLVASGCMATVSQSLGAGLATRANRYAGLIIMLSASMGTIVAAAAVLLEPAIFRVMGISESLRPALSTFFTAYCCQLPFYYVLIMVNSIFRAYKKVLFPLLTLIIMAVANLVGDLGFGLGRFSFPAFGAAGIAWTTFACAVLGLACNLLLAARYGLLHRRTFAPWRWNRRAMPYLFRVGMPAAAGHIITHLGSLATLAIVGLLPESTSALAGMSVGGRVHAVLLFPLGALNMSMVIVSGHLLGGGERQGLYHFGRRAALRLGLVLVVPSLVLWLLREQAASLFSGDPAVLRQASAFLFFSCLTVPLTGMTGMMNALFSGAGATMLSCRVGAVTCWVAGIPLALLLGIAMNMGAPGVFAAGAAGQTAAFLWTLRIFHGKKWLEYGMRKRQTA
ncbi:MATE family efflux transporter [uncultured Mailhella sp.]|uniref:MATE family efflux transporter n=1 Tax=uncultured Mailhella sp. TaxID=1981031 RepID=UPI0025D4F896|nr:MATE family efflux transporter [uncultured Mailhella sp.]